jgi:hypothetical protein
MPVPCRNLVIVVSAWTHWRNRDVKVGALRLSELNAVEKVFVSCAQITGKFFCLVTSIVQSIK